MLVKGQHPPAKGHHMRHARSSSLLAAFALLIPSLLYVHNVHAQGDANRLVAGGGISVPGWVGKVDADAEQIRSNS